MKAFAPAHITGFFITYDDLDPLRTGSCGAGLSLADGALTGVSLSDQTEVRLNGRPAEASTTEAVIRLLTDRPVRVETRLGIPVGGGLGASAAGAVSTALALNARLGLRKTLNELLYAAHVAEVTNGTGLGDVSGMSSGGVEIRRKPGVPFDVDRIPVPPMFVYYVHFGPVSTKAVLADAREKAMINAAGRRCLKALLARPTFAELMRLSRSFAVETGLISARALDAVEAVESHGGLASMAMLGDTVFATVPGGLAEFGEVRRAAVDMAGPRLLNDGHQPDYFNSS
ncbi:MAG: Pantoate kinase [Methanocella sp. PtaU1.Bin125]|nr:MAG: Pantoate kinase [Methanocella sp. PtaU1.Bin125]